MVRGTGVRGDDTEDDADDADTADDAPADDDADDEEDLLDPDDTEDDTTGATLVTTGDDGFGSCWRSCVE